jgi:hypothetical protein
VLDICSAVEASMGSAPPCGDPMVSHATRFPGS